MKQEFKNLLSELKDNNEDFELYPTTPEMIYCIDRCIRNNNVNVLDIGAGTCNFKKYSNKVKEYQAIEKSDILVENFPEDVIVVGRDFWNTNLIDKESDVIFCNPPYSEYIEWTCKIIKTGNAKNIFLVIPDRWKENKQILNCLDKDIFIYEVIGSFDFLNAERQARAKVDVLHIKNISILTAFDRFFKEEFNIEENDYNYNEKQEKIERINEVISKGDLVKNLCELYNKGLNELSEEFNSLKQIKNSTLKTIGVKGDEVKKALWLKLQGLKILYWEELFNNLNSINTRLTKKSREELFNNFSSIKTIDFNESNIYTVLIWLCKNINIYLDKQLKEVYFDLTTIENISNYKSNQKAWDTDNWKFSQEKKNMSCYKLENRIILDSYRAFETNPFSKFRNQLIFEDITKKINDIIVIANNLGFIIKALYEVEEQFGTTHCVYMQNGDLFCEYKIYKKGTVHLKLNSNFMKAFNIAISQLMGWVRNKQEASEELDINIKEVGQYFNLNNINKIGNSKLLLK